MVRAFVALMLLAMVAVPVLAQGQPGMMPGMGMPGGMPGMMPGMGMGMPGMGMPGMGMPGMMGMPGPGMQPPAPVMMIVDGVVYIAYDGKLSAFDAKTLNKIGEATYYEHPKPMMPMGPPNGMGGMGMGPQPGGGPPGGGGMPAPGQ